MSGFSFKDWQHPAHTIKLCQHIAQHGPGQWQELAVSLECPATLLELKWHVTQLGRIGSVAKVSKAYSDWELCVLFLATTGLQPLTKKAMHKELAEWLPGRSPDGLRQAYAHNVAGHEAKLWAKIKANKWPTDLSALLAAWPGPSPQTQGILDKAGIDAHKAAAADLLQELSAWVPTGKKQKLAADDAQRSSAAAHMPHMSSMMSLELAHSNAPLPTQQSQQQLLLRAQSCPRPLVQQHQVVDLHEQHVDFMNMQLQQQGMQQPVMGLNAFGGLRGMSDVQDGPNLGLCLPNLDLLQCDLALQIAADLASPCDSHCAWTSSSNPAALACTGGTGASYSATGGLSSQQLLTHVLPDETQGEGQGTQGEIGKDPGAGQGGGLGQAADLLPQKASPAVAAAAAAGTHHHQQQQVGAGGHTWLAGMPNTDSLLTAVGLGPQVLHGSALAAANMGQLSSQQLQELVALIHCRLDQQQQLIVALLAELRQEVRSLVKSQV